MTGGQDLVNVHRRRLRRQILDTAAAVAVFPLALLAVLAVQQYDKRAGAR